MNRPEASYRERIYRSYRSWKEAKSPSSSGIKKRLGEIFPSWIYPELRFFAEVGRDANILELGCGNGDFLRVLKNAGFSRLTGVDFQVNASEDSIAFVATDLIEFLRTDQRKFRVIYFFDVLEHFTKDEIVQILDLIRQRLESGGMVVARVPNVASLTGFYNQYSDFSHESSFTELSLHQVFQAAEFGSVEVTGVEIWAKTLIDPRRWIGLLFFALRAIYIKSIAIAFGGPKILTSNLVAVAREP